MFNHPFTAVNFAVFPHRGVLGGDTARRSLAAMAAKTGCRWVILTPAGVQATPYSEEIDYRSAATPTDEELIDCIRFARSLGLEVALKPTVNCANGVWRARISFFDHDVPCESQWGRWFAQYTAFQLHYAEIAAREGCKLFITGCEMTMTEHRETEWRQLLTAVRRVYPGTLTYNCDKYGEDHIAWWDAVDVIASSGYYPLQDWQRQLARIGQVAEKFRKPVLFTEAGCMAVHGSAAVPNNWELTGAPDDAEQAAWYKAMFDACRHAPFIQGFGVWDWPADLNTSNPYAVSGRPAADIIETYYKGVYCE